jgi:hypothetical protein
MRFLFLALFLFSLPLFSEAQLLQTEGLIDTSLTLEVEPSLPNPEDVVTVTLSDYSGLYYGAEVQWYLNDKEIPDTKNNRSVSFTAARLGSTDVIKATLKKQNGVIESITKKITPAYLDIIIEPQTHVPSFYKGRALPSVGSTLNVTALLSNGKMMAPEGLIYTWRINQKVFEGGPLRGRNKISFSSGQESSIIISLQISDSVGNVVAKRGISVNTMQPKLLFYELNALYGTEAKALQTLAILGNSASFRAEPYYLDSQTFNFPDIFEWSINGTEFENRSLNPYEVTLEKTGYPGTAELKLHVRNTTQLLQGTQGSIAVSI